MSTEFVPATAGRVHSSAARCRYVVTRPYNPSSADLRTLHHARGKYALVMDGTCIIAVGTVKAFVAHWARCTRIADVTHVQDAVTN